MFPRAVRLSGGSLGVKGWERGYDGSEYEKRTMPLLREQECSIRVSCPGIGRTSGGEDVRNDSETEFHLPGLLAAICRGRVINKNRMGWDQVLNLDI